MNTRILRNTLTLALSASVGMVMFSGCGGATPAPAVKKVEEAPVVVKKASGPAELYLSSSSIKTKVGSPKTTKRYDLTVNIDNTKNASAFVNLKNKGASTLTLSKINFKDNSENLFSLSSACGESIKPYSECKLKITFNGKYKGEYTSNITINSNSNGKSVGNVGKIHVIAKAKDRLTGVINFLDTAQNRIQNTPMTKLSFRTGSLVQYIEVKNNGIEDINIKGMRLTGKDQKNFTVTQECPKTLKVGQSCELEISYKRKFNGMALSYLIIDSDGVLSPSDTIRLKGAPLISSNAPEILRLADNDGMNIAITAVSTTENNQKFLEDFSNVKPVYYFRTMYQNSTDTKFKEYYEEIVSYYFSKNGYKITNNPRRADKIVNLYPAITIAKNGKGSIQIIANVKANIVTKAANAKPTDEKIEFNMTVIVDNYSDDYFAYVGASNLINSFMFNLLGLQE